MKKATNPFDDVQHFDEQLKVPQEFLMLRRAIERSAARLKRGKSTIVSVPGLLDFVDYETACFVVDEINKQADKTTGVFAYLKQNRSKVNLLTKYFTQKKARKARPRKETLGGLPLAILEDLRSLKPFGFYIISQSDISHTLASVKANITRYTPYKSRVIYDAQAGFLVVIHIGDYAAAHAAGKNIL